MSYVNCPRCGLSVALRVDAVSWESCPRCLGRAGISVPMYVSSRRLWPAAPPRPSAAQVDPDPVDSDVA